MEEGDIVNIRNCSGGHWRGEITTISEGWENLPYSHPIATIHEINGPGYAVVMEHDLSHEDGEYWEI